jgi:hypothetical protein
MAEMNNTEQTDNPQDLERVQSFIRSQVESYLQEQAAQQQYQQRQSASDQQRQPTEREDAQRVLREAINPIIGPDIASANLNAADAKDYVDFYTGNDAALSYKDEVEKVFNDLKNQGRAMPRSAILRYVRGELYETDQAKFTERESARTKRQIERAEGAIDIGAATLNKAKNDPMFTNFDRLPTEEMEKVLEGVTF